MKGRIQYRGRKKKKKWICGLQALRSPAVPNRLFYMKKLHGSSEPIKGRFKIGVTA